MSDQADEHRVVARDLDIHGGDPVFAGTRVPVQILVDYLEGGDGLELFLDQYPTVSRDQAEAARAAILHKNMGEQRMPLPWSYTTP